MGMMMSDERRGKETVHQKARFHLLTCQNDKLNKEKRVFRMHFLLLFACLYFMTFTSIY